MSLQSLLKILAVAIVTCGLVVLRLQPVQSEKDLWVRSVSDARMFLTQNGFTIVDEKPGDHVSGQAKDCSVIIKPVAAEGWNESQMEIMAAGKKLFFVTDGKVYQGQQPRWQTWSRLQLYRFLRRLGVEIREVAVFGVATSSGCENTGVDWAGLTADNVSSHR